MSLAKFLPSQNPADNLRVTSQGFLRPFLLSSDFSVDICGSLNDIISQTAWNQSMSVSWFLLI